MINICKQDGEFITSESCQKISVTDLRLHGIHDSLQDQVTLGMHIQEFCGSWMDHPFWRENFVLSDPDDLRKQAERECQTIEKYLKAGYPHSPIRGNTTIRGALRLAAEELGISTAQLRSMIRSHVVDRDEDLNNLPVHTFQASDLVISRFLTNAQRQQSIAETISQPQA